VLDEDDELLEEELLDDAELEEEDDDAELDEEEEDAPPLPPQATKPISTIAIPIILPRLNWTPDILPLFLFVLAPKR